MTALRLLSPLDRAFFALVTRGWNAHKIASYESTLRRRDKEMSAEASHTFASIDAKATGLLTHTSMMIAGLGLIAPLVADSDFEVGIVVMEMAIYLLIALGCLRCLSVFHAHEFEAADHVQDVIHREPELYSLCIRAVILFTMVVFALLPLLYFWTSEKAA
jgi:hypothetical protein